MNKLNKNKRIFIFVVLAIQIAACASSAKTEIKEAVSQQPTPTNLPATSTIVIPTKTATLVIIFTPTPDTRIPPEQWQSWPIIPEVTNRAIKIFKKGQANGVNPNAFSKIGDCQNVKESFMGIYDTGIYFLQDWQKDWQQTIDQFKGYYNRDSLAFGQGLNVAAALSPLHADPANCQPSENPVQCELRVINPAYAFIRFERWYPDVTPPETYEKYLRQILDLVIDHGTVPILMTKADNVEGGHQINVIIAKLAYEYDIPLYNWWRAAQALPNHGLDPERDDKFHIDPEYAWTEQSAYGLGSLDSTWKRTKGY
ncbi:MAG: hypothetical protein MUO42_08430 [Anaerolineaceae bacterium]|nr:hypothetical protein [Anaerolineaceae bacterium]